MSTASQAKATEPGKTEPAPSAVMNTYGRFPIALERGAGAHLWDTDGKKYLDFYGGIAVNSVGHAHPHVVQALKDQAEKLWHASNLFVIPEQERFARRLTEDSFADVAFFCNSGVEAMEAAIKAGRRYHYKNGAPERWRTITVAGAFHGRSLGTIAAAGNAKYLEGFGKPADGFDSVPFGNMNALRDAIGPETAAIAVEPVQGEGGINAARLDYLRDLRAAADEFGLMLIFDEIQCGMGRTGKMWAHEWAGVAPDILASAKGIGGGFPLGAVLATHKGASGMEPGVHGTTYGGNPLAMAVGNAVLDVLLADGFLDGVDAVARRLWFKLQDLVAAHGDVFVEARGAGLMLGLKCAPEHVNLDVIKALMAGGLLTVGAADNVVRLLPPLIVTDADCDEAIRILTETAVSLSAKAKA
ncbi:MAG: aspartate aminotransferase family protein [Alphaproteobacteria bacterium]|nr:aspartate aminotransferase family protein [Alphaproteobacteria bacterium]